MAIVGIDLGTTRSAVARLDEMGRPQIIPNMDGDLFTHSVVLFESKNNKVVGKVAKQNAVAYPDQVAEFVKNHVGRETAGDKWDFFGESYGPEEISAIILRRLKEDAEEALGEPAERAVITVPAIFGEAERNATKTAGMIAGLDVIGLLDEPVAAALAYGFGLSTTNGESQNVMLYDLGGGTFDLTVMRISGDEITVLMTDGDRSLGGRLWDDRIIEFVTQQFEAEHGEDPLEDSESYQDLRNRTEDAKIALTRRGQTRILCQHRGKTSKVELTQDEFNEMTADLLSQTETICQLVMGELQESGKLPGGWSDIHHILLVGGSTRMPQIAEMLRRISDKEPEMLEADLVVAQGAVIYAAMKIIQEAKETGNREILQQLPPGIERLLGGKEVTKACSFALGLECLDKKDPDGERTTNEVLIQRNTELPAEETYRFLTVRPDQTEVLLPILEGEDTDLELCKILGEGRITGIPGGLPADSPVDVTIRLTDESLVEVTAIEKTHNMRCEFELKREQGMSRTEIGVAKKRLEMDVVE